MRTVKEIMKRELSRTTEDWLTLYFNKELKRKLRYLKREIVYYSNDNDNRYNTLKGASVINASFNTNEIKDLTGNRVATLDYHNRKAIAKYKIYHKKFIDIRKALGNAREEGVMDQDMLQVLKETLRWKNKKSIKQAYRERNLNYHYETFRQKRNNVINFIGEQL